MLSMCIISTNFVLKLKNKTKNKIKQHETHKMKVCCDILKKIKKKNKIYYASNILHKTKNIYASFSLIDDELFSTFG